MSVSQLCKIGCSIYKRKEKVEISHWAGTESGVLDGGRYFLTLADMISTSSVSSVLDISSPIPDIDVLDHWHCRLADTSHQVIRESVRHKLIESITVDWKNFYIKNRKNCWYPCNISAHTRMNRVTFVAVQERLVGLSPGSYMSMDVLIMQNNPYRKRYRYVFSLLTTPLRCA